MPGPLDGVKIIELGQALAGPLAGVIMADLGADVIKVEKPDGGDDARLWGPPGSGPRIVGLPISFDRQRPHPLVDSPTLGQHNTEILGATS